MMEIPGEKQFPMEKFESQEIADVYSQYPQHMRLKVLFLRQLILDTALETLRGYQLQETLKWGEPGYLSKTGSTIRLGWKQSAPERYAIYFHCKTRLVDTFRERYGDRFRFEGNRAIVFFRKRYRTRG